MLRDQLVARDVDQQIALAERLDDCRQNAGDDFERGAGDAARGDEDARVEVLLYNVVGKRAHLLDAHIAVAAELDPHRPDGGLRVGIAGCGRVGVLAEHGFGGARGEVHERSVRRAVFVGEALFELGEGDVDLVGGELVALAMESVTRENARGLVRRPFSLLEDKSNAGQSDSYPICAHLTCSHPYAP